MEICVWICTDTVDTAIEQQKLAKCFEKFDWSKAAQDKVLTLLQPYFKHLGFRFLWELAGHIFDFGEKIMKAVQTENSSELLNLAQIVWDYTSRALIPGMKDKTGERSPPPSTKTNTMSNSTDFGSHWSSSDDKIRTSKKKNKSRALASLSPSDSSDLSAGEDIAPKRREKKKKLELVPYERSKVLPSQSYLSDSPSLSLSEISDLSDSSSLSLSEKFHKHSLNNRSRKSKEKKRSRALPSPSTSDLSDFSAVAPKPKHSSRHSSSHHHRSSNSSEGKTVLSKEWTTKHQKFKETVQVYSTKPKISLKKEMTIKGERFVESIEMIGDDAKQFARENKIILPSSRARITER